jgi:tRNA G18 (ribose-2'-O)-methylase SpoU
VRGYFGIGIVNGKTKANVGTLWRSAQAFGADFLFTVGRRYAPQASDTGDAIKHVPLFEFASLDDLVSHLPRACPLIGVELTDEARPLDTYVHPERGAYLLGAEDWGLRPPELARCHEIVSIGGAARCLNVASAGSIVLYDRVAKGQFRRKAS